MLGIKIIEIRARLIIILFFVGLTTISCSSNVENTGPEPNFVMAVGGHIYGHPDRYTSSVYPNFLKQLDSLKLLGQPDLLVLTGDVVAHPTEENWNNIKSELDELNVEWHISPGNHDISLYMDEVIQPYKYIRLEKEENLILILNTSHPGWTVDSLQAVFIQESLTDLDSMKNIFVFTHQLWWQKNAPSEFELDSIRTNSYAGFDGENNFWKNAFPYFEGLDQDIFFVAGDIGCFEGLTAYYEDHYENYHFYGSGMGGGLEDNYLLIRTFQDGKVDIQKVDF